MTPPNHELVLCSATAELPPAWLPAAGATPLPEATLYQHLDHLAPRWLPRSQAEHEPRNKQWIPYVLLLNPHQQLAAYTRNGTENRLHGLWSLGIGGHINPCDAPPPDQNFNWRHTIQNGLRRELAEEYPSALPGHTQFLGLIHETLTSVGQVHLGLVFLHQPRAPLALPGPELHCLQWLPAKTLGSHPEWPPDKFELWSQLALQLLPPPEP